MSNFTFKEWHIKLNYCRSDYSDQIKVRCLARNFGVWEILQERGGANLDWENRNNIQVE